LGKSGYVPSNPRFPNAWAIQTEMEGTLGCRVQTSDRKGRVKIVTEYARLEDFDRVVEMLK
jgi:hypothetical protein